MIFNDVIVVPEDASPTDATPSDASLGDNVGSDDYSQFEGVYRGIDAYSTDYRLYTVNLTQVPTTVAQQAYALELEIRNLLLIFICFYCLLKIYGMIKNTFINFFGRD